MNGRRVNRVFLSVAAIIFLLLNPVLDEYRDLIDIEGFPSSTSFEKRHPEDVAVGKGDDCQRLILAGSVFSIFILDLAANFSLQLLRHQISTVSSPIEQSSVLRR